LNHVSYLCDALSHTLRDTIARYNISCKVKEEQELLAIYTTKPKEK